jgi:hypothetical protein
MRRRLIAVGAFSIATLGGFCLQACSGDDNALNVPGADASHDSSTQDTSTGDVSSPDSSPDSAADSGGDANDGGCPAAWMIEPTVDTTIAVPGDAGPLFLHAGAIGTQDYTCLAVVADAGADGGDAGTTYVWTFVGPEADLHDCHAVKIGSHLASDGGATRPEWIEIAGDYVIGKKHSAFTPDGGAGSIPWLLVDTVSTGGTGPLTKTNNVQRLYTDGGNAPATGCDGTNVNATQKVPYVADYYFYGQ